MPTCNQVGFLLLKGDQGRAPSAPPSFPPKSIGGGSPLQLRAWEGLGRGKGESRARTSEAREFRSRRRRILKNRDTRDSRENQGRFRGGLGEMTTPVRPSAATLLRLPPCIFGCILTCFSSSPPPPPRSQAKATQSTRHLSHTSSLRRERCRVFMGFLAYKRGGGRGLRGFGVVSERGSRGGAEGQMRGFRGEKEKGD